MAETAAPISPPEEPAPPARVLSVHAHPDDQEFSVGGTLAKWTQAGSEVISVCVTSGEAGSNKYIPAEVTRETLRPVREEEQRRACAVLGIREVLFLGYPDGALAPTLELRRELTRLIRRYRPDAVVCGDPTVRYYGTSYMNHPDHRATADATLDAVFPSAGTRFIFPELLADGLEPHEVAAVYIHGADQPDTFVDISQVMETKVAALMEHRSQLGEWDPREMLAGWAEEQGRPRGLPAAEAFRRMVLAQPQ
ncbi:MAG: PIG-L family deacetylase [Chloroflexi bacterium]|nr:PIG-L family deacetylase [Chloroflexota bacterium]